MHLFQGLAYCITNFYLKSHFVCLDSVELFERTCDDAYEWMLEKLEKIETDDIGRDKKTVQALQRKHQVSLN